MRVVFAGTPDTAAPSLRALLDSEHDVVAVITRPDARAGRGRTPHPSPIKQVAAEHGLEVLTPGSPRDPEFQARLRELRPDVCAVVAYGALLPRDVLDIPRHGWVNLHFSVLPAWRGAAPVQRAIMAGDTTTGATTFVIEEGLDTGPILGIMTETITDTDTTGTLLGRLADSGAHLLRSTLDGLATGQLSAQPQPTDGVSHAPKLTSADAEIRWEMPSYAVSRQIRGCTPAPGAWTTFRGERIGVECLSRATAEGLDADVLDALTPGEICAGKRAVAVGTASGAYVLDTVRPHGKKAMAAADWARGARITTGERFERAQASS